jgi:hypothetical protein
MHRVIFAPSLRRNHLWFLALGLLLLGLIAAAAFARNSLEGYEYWPFRTIEPTAEPVAPDSDADTTDFLVGPYLQLPTPPTGMTVMWETKDKLPGRVEFGPTRDLGKSVENSSESNLHELRLDDLKPGATYFYRVRSGEQTSKIYSFKAAPPLGTKRWRMAVYGDSRTNPGTHRKVVEQIAKADVDLILHTGDIVTSGRDHDSWRKQFFEPLEPLMHSVPWVSTIGNHESDSDNYFSYMALPGNERYFGFDFADAHIVCLDSNSWIQKGRDSKQYKWMDEHFHAEREAKWTFVAFHHPLFSAHKTRAINSLRWDWTPLFLEPECHVDGVLTGHDHFYARNFRMGKLQEELQPGVLFLTTAGGGASLYPSVARDYVAKEKSAHHFTLFDFDDDKVTLTAIDIEGKVIESYIMTKKSTPAEEFCAYEVEEFREFLRKACVVADPIRFRAGEKEIHAELKVPTRFAVPVSGKLIWHTEPGWNLKDTEIPFKLAPNKALTISLLAEVAEGPLSSSPTLTIAFEPGRFHNRTVEVTPFTLAGPERVDAGKADKPISVDGAMDEKSWAAASEQPLLGLAPRGGRRDGVRVLDDKDRVYVGVRVDDPENKVEIKADAHNTSGSRLVLMGEHVRVILSDGTRTETFALSPEHMLYESVDHAEEPCDAAVAHQRGMWCAEMAISRKLFPDWSRVRMNVVHRRQEGKEGVEYHLCPAFTLGGDPDRIPDAKPSDDPAKFAKLRLD